MKRVAKNTTNKTITRRANKNADQETGELHGAARVVEQGRELQVKVT
jgi:hypothetical protein